MRRDQDIRQAPQWTRRIKRLAFKHIQNSATQLAVFKRGNKSRLTNNLSARNINNDCAAIEACDLSRTNQAIGAGYEWRRNYENVTAVKRLVQSIRAHHGVNKWRRRLVQSAANAGDAHSECLGATG